MKLPRITLLAGLLVLGIGLLLKVNSSRESKKHFQTVAQSISSSGGGGGVGYVASSMGPGSGVESSRFRVLREDEKAPAKSADGRPAGADATATSPAPPAKMPADGGRRPPSGLLTAGLFDDTLNPDVFRKFLRKLEQDQTLGELPRKLLGRQLMVHVQSADGAPVGHAQVRITSSAGRSVALLSRTDGRVIVVSRWDELADDDDWTVTVTPPDGSPVVQQTVAKGEGACQVVLPKTRGRLPTTLDLALVVDTTGSMGDELEYLKAEIRGIATAISERFPQVQQRYALILYRDQGDEYVTRRFDFTPSLSDFRKQLSAQAATGGGDMPEAMHQALEDATQLEWRADHTARLLFLVGDAPPHRQFMQRTLTAVDRLRKQGVAIYPVACSGYDPPCEFVMRSAALLTGGQFLFLTDDSGVGHAHAEPHIPCYQVQHLEQAMIRMIASELAGKRLEAAAKDVIRTVGKPANGKCAGNEKPEVEELPAPRPER